MSIAPGNPSTRIEAAFRRIAAGGMAAMPLSNPALQVEAVGFHAWQGAWVGVLITPWAINLMLLPGESAAFRPLALNEKQHWAFASGDYEFMGATDAELGSYQFCSLFSPAFDFAGQDEARAVAEAVVAALHVEATVAPAAAAASPAQSVKRLATEPVSRRGFLTGGFFGGRS